MGLFEVIRRLFRKQFQTETLKSSNAPETEWEYDLDSPPKAIEKDRKHSIIIPETHEEKSYSVVQAIIVSITRCFTLRTKQSCGIFQPIQILQ